MLLFFTWLWDQGRRDVLVSGDWHGNTLLHKVQIDTAHRAKEGTRKTRP